MSGRMLVVTVARSVTRSRVVQKGIFLAIAGVPLLMAADANAQSTGGSGGGFGQFMTGFMQRFDFSAAVPVGMGLVGVTGAGISAGKLYKDIQDGGRIGDNMGNIAGLAASFLSLGFAGVIAAGRSTVGG